MWSESDGEVAAVEGDELRFEEDVAVDAHVAWCARLQGTIAV